MKAWVLHDVSDLRFENVETPIPGKKEVLVNVKAAGICGSDISRIYRTGTYRFPLIPGHEFCGIVTDLGAESAPHWLGRRVGVFPLIPCRKCVPCQRKQYELCRNYSYLGSRRDGGFAEYVAVPEENLVEIPDGVSFEEAAMLEPMAVAVHAIRRLAPVPKDTVAVCGLGAIGLMLTMFLREAGAENLLLIGNKESQRQAAMRLGVSANHFCNSREQDPTAWLMKQTGGLGADVVFECVGKPGTIVQTIDFATPGGRICLVGNPSSNVCLEKSVYWKILRNQLTVTGSWNSSFYHEAADDWQYVLGLLSIRKIDSLQFISHRFLLENLDDGLDIMRDKTENYMRILLV